MTIADDGAGLARFRRRTPRRNRPAQRPLAPHPLYGDEPASTSAVPEAGTVVTIRVPLSHAERRERATA
jgi:hypothetical protein